MNFMTHFLRQIALLTYFRGQAHVMASTGQLTTYTLLQHFRILNVALCVIFTDHRGLGDGFDFTDYQNLVPYRPISVSILHSIYRFITFNEEIYWVQSHYCSYRTITGALWQCPHYITLCTVILCEFETGTGSQYVRMILTIFVVYRNACHADETIDYF